jgi:preprotein translocase subunit SecE
MNFLSPILAQIPPQKADFSHPESESVFGFWNIFWAFAAVVFLYLLLRYRVNVLKFVGEVRVELDKCSWPWDPNQTGFKKFKELRDSTVVVILSVILLAGFVTSADWLLTHLVGFLTGTGLMNTAHAAKPLVP